jgi:hypothetical protein
MPGQPALGGDDDEVLTGAQVQQRGGEQLPGLAAAVFQQQRGNRLAEARPDPPLAADAAAGQLEHRHLSLGHVLHGRRRHG